MGLKFRRGTTAQKSGSLAFGEPYVNTDLGTLQIGGATGDITLGASGTGSQGSFAGISGSSLDITGNAKIDGNLTLGGAITIGDQTTDTVNVVASLSSSLVPSVTNAFDLGSASKIWRDIYVSTGSIKIINPGTGTVVGTITSNANGDINTGTQNVSGSLNVTGSITPGATNTYDLGSPTKQWRHVYISTGSLYMNGTAILSSTATDLTLTTDAGQSLKLLESAADTITLQTAEGNLTLTSTGAGDVILDPNTGVVSIKGTLQVQDGNKITSSGGNTIQFGNNVAITGSIITTGALTVGGNLTVQGTTTQIDSTTLNIGDNIINLNGTGTTNGGIYVRDAAGGNTITGSLLWDTTNDKWIAGPLGSELAILRVGGDSVVSGSSQITYASISSIPAGIVSGSSQVIGILSSLNTYTGSNDTTNTTQNTSISNLNAATSSYETKGRGIVSGSAQIDGSLLGSNKTITVGSTSITLGGTTTTIAGLTSVTSTAFVGALTGNASTVTTNANLTGNITSVGNATTIASGVVTSDMIVDGTIVNGDINASAAIVDTKLATISTAGKVSNSATTATSVNTLSAIVARDASGNFSAGTISAALTGNVTGNVSGTAATVTGAAQTAITSVGTLTALTVTGAITANGGVAVTGALTATGDITAYYSDGRLKENLQVIPNALEKVSKLTGYTYNTNTLGKQLLNNENDNDIKVGIIAQDLQEVLPQAVKFAPFDRDAEGNSKSGENYLTVQYEKIVPLLIQAIKEQQTQIHSLTLEIEKLKESKGL